MSKGFLSFCGCVGGLVGGYIPVLLGQDDFSIWTIIGGLVGGLLGIYIGVKLSR
jgi:hypothetical protein